MMHVMITILAGTAGYLLVACLTCAVLFKTNPFDVFDRDDSDGHTGAWIVGMGWPVAVPILLFVMFLARVVGPLMGWITNMMVGFVDWMTKERPKKPNLPKAQVRK